MFHFNLLAQGTVELCQTGVRNIIDYKKTIYPKREGNTYCISVSFPVNFDSAQKIEPDFPLFRTLLHDDVVELWIALLELRL